MNLTDRRRKLLFAGLLVVLAAVGVYLTVASPGGDASDKPKDGPSGTASAAAPGPSSAPPGVQEPVKPGGVDIYRLLPFSQQEFANAASLAQRFVAAYGTYRYDEPPEVYMGRFADLATDNVKQQLGQGAGTPAMLEERQRQQLVAQGTATLDRVRTIEDNSVIFLVTGKQQVTKSGATSSDSKQYAVTVARDSGSLKVYSFEPAESGQEGDTG